MVHPSAAGECQYPRACGMRHVDVIRSFIAPAPVVSKKLVKTAICSTSAIS